MILHHITNRFFNQHTTASLSFIKTVVNLWLELIKLVYFEF